MRNYVVNCYTCQHNGQETCKGCNTLLDGENEPYENWELREDLNEKDHQIELLTNRWEKLKEFAESVFNLDKCNLSVAHILDKMQELEKE